MRRSLTLAGLTSRLGKILVPAAAIVVALATAGPAIAAVNLEGQTSTGAKVKLALGDGGSAKQLKVNHYEAECGGGDLVWSVQFKKFKQPAGPSAFETSDKDNSKDGKFKLKTKAQASGQSISGEPSSAWQGSVSAVTRVFKKGRQIDECGYQAEWNAAPAG
jgi:hypothetical protein